MRPCTVLAKSMKAPSDDLKNIVMWYSTLQKLTDCTILAIICNISVNGNPALSGQMCYIHGKLTLW